MRKLNYKHGSHSVDQHSGNHIRLTNKESNPDNYYWSSPLEDVEIILEDNGELEINAKVRVWDSLSGRKVEGFDLSNYDMSIYKNENEYSYMRTTKERWRKKVVERVFSQYLLKKERTPYHYKTNVKWSIITDDGFNFNQQ